MPKKILQLACRLWSASLANVQRCAAQYSNCADIVWTLIVIAQSWNWQHTWGASETLKSNANLSIYKRTTVLDYRKWCFGIWCFKGSIKMLQSSSAKMNRLYGLSGLQNEDGIENTLGITNYSFSSFCTKNYFVFEGRVVELVAYSQSCGAHCRPLVFTRSGYCFKLRCHDA